MLEVTDLVVRYGAVEALHGISLRVLPRQIVCLIGANGAGKTTLLRALSGLEPAYSGRMVYRRTAEGPALELHKQPTHVIVAAGIAHAPEGRGIFPSMTVAENLALGAYLRRDRAGIAEDTQRVFSLFPRLQERQQQLAGTLSGGEQQMLAIGRALSLIHI